jgi:hypothetical protein
VNKYREGTVKRTPVRGVKKYLKPIAYNVWEPGPFGLWPKDESRVESPNCKVKLAALCAVQKTLDF